MRWIGQAALTPAELGWKFIHWGLGLFITRIPGRLRPDPALHARRDQAGDVGPAFLKNITLWWGCPGILAELTLKTGSLGMIVIGFCYLALARDGTVAQVSSREQLAVSLCSYGLIADVVAAGAGYVICNHFWPNFFHTPYPRERTCGSQARASAPPSMWSVSSSHSSISDMQLGG